MQHTLFTVNIFFSHGSIRKIQLKGTELKKKIIFTVIEIWPIQTDVSVMWLFPIILHVFDHQRGKVNGGEYKNQVQWHKPVIFTRNEDFQDSCKRERR